MIFCPACETYLPPNLAACPTCGRVRLPAAPVEAAWSVRLEAVPVGPPLAVGDGLLLLSHDSGQTPGRAGLHRLSLDGLRQGETQLWQGRLIGGAVAVPAQTLEVLEPTRVAALVAVYGSDPLAKSGGLVALDPAGRERWRWPAGAHMVSAPALAGRMAWVTTNTGLLVGLDLAGGLEQRRISLGLTPSQAAPALADGVAYIPCRGPRLLAVGLDGSSRWRFEAETGWLDRTPLPLGDRLYAVSNIAGTVIALDRAGGRPCWQVPLGPQVGKRLSPPAGDGERLYLGAGDGLYAFSLADGRQVWHFPTRRRIVAAPVILAGVVYAAAHDHHLYALETGSGRLLWSYQAASRLEVPPLITSGPYPLAILAGHDGRVTALRRPLSPAEHEAAGQRLEAAMGYAGLGRFSQAATLLQEHGEPFKAAQLWQAEGRLEQAAQQYQLAGRWEQAAGLWQQLDRPRDRAMALEQQARSLAGQAAGDEEQAQAWQTAAQAWRDLGEDEAAEASHAEMARYRRLPHLSIAVEHGPLSLKRWATLRFIVKNEGYGPANQLIIRAKGGQFEGQVAETRRIATLPAGRTQTDILDLRPLAEGESVPLRVSLEYQDQHQTEHTWRKTLYLPVGQPAPQEDLKVGKETAYSERKPGPPESKGPLRILFLAANPFETDRLRLDQEVRTIDERLRAAQFRDNFNLVQHWAVRATDLSDHLLRYSPHLVHFSGHGSKSGKIVLEDETGQPQAVTPAALRRLFHILKDNIRCVVLNACLSLTQAAALVEEIDCVVGMSAKIEDQAAIRFAGGFYRGLGYGRSLQTAFELGCNEIDLVHLEGEAIPQLLVKPGVDPARIIFG